MSYWVYLLRCSDDTLYTGSTTELIRRVKEHNQSRLGAKYTAARQPVSLQQAWEVSDRSSAQRLESRLKRCTRQKKLELINDGEGIRALVLNLGIEIKSIYNRERGEDDEHSLDSSRCHEASDDRIC